MWWWFFSLRETSVKLYFIWFLLEETQSPLSFVLYLGWYMSAIHVRSTGILFLGERQYPHCSLECVSFSDHLNLFIVFWDCTLYIFLLHYMQVPIQVSWLMHIGPWSLQHYVNELHDISLLLNLFNAISKSKRYKLQVEHLVYLAIIIVTLN